MRLRAGYTAFAGLRIDVGPIRFGAGSDQQGLRSYITIGVGRTSGQVQVQRPGFVLPHHTDGPEHNRAASITLRRPESGGELRVLGEHRRLLRGRVTLFDGGRDYHYVTHVEGRKARVVVIVQRSSPDAVRP